MSERTEGSDQPATAVSARDMPPGGRTGRPLRILVVNWQDRENPLGGGAEVHLHEVFGRIAALGHEVTLLCSGWKGAPPRVDLDGIEIHRVGGRHTLPVRAFPYYRSRLSGRDFDVIVEDLNKVSFFTPFWGPTPVVLLVHHLFGLTAFREATPLVAGITLLLERPVPRIFRKTPVIAVSESTRSDLVRRGMTASSIRVVPNGIDMDRFSGPTAGRFSEPTLIYLGRIRRYKRLDLVLEALSALRSRDVRVRLLIAGKGSDQERLLRLRDRLGLQDQVEMLGFVSEEKKVELLHRAWINVLTSPKEGWGITNIEAAACGTPSIASDSPGLRDSVLHGETGFLVPHGDVTALADRIEELVRDRTLVDELGARARSFAETFSWDGTAERVLEVIRETAGV